MTEASEQPGDIRRLLAIMARLRDPDGGCPWDLEQTFGSIAPYTVEEAYEVAEAIHQGDMAALRDELGDLLFQVVFYAQMAQEAGAFAFADIVAAICEKMLRRHPHVFGKARIADAEAQTQAWEVQKAAERRVRAEAAGRLPSLLDGVGLGLPGLTRAIKLQNRAARVGFDWPNILPVLDKLEEEIRELRHEIDTAAAPERLQDEAGDVLFGLANLCRHLKIDPEAALRHTNGKFERRFRRIEALLAERGKPAEAADLAELDALWDQAKAEERA